MRILSAILIWLFLANPMLNIGQAWQTRAVPGPVVTVSTKDGQQNGHIVVELDGSRTLVTPDGRNFPLRDEPIQGNVVQSANRPSVFQSAWRGIAPLVALTCICVLIAWPSRRR